MIKSGLYGLNQKKENKYNSYKGQRGRIADNLLLDEINKYDSTKIYRNFSANKPNEKWGTDVSMFKIKYGKLYLSPIIDMYDSSVISFNISIDPVFMQIQDMLDKAFNQNSDLNGLILHSDQGWQYQQKPYQLRLQNKGILQSMSRKGNCLDNSPTENFFSIMKNEMFYGQEDTFNSLEELKEAMIDYIDYYNNQRISVKRKGLTPIQYSHQALNQL